MYSITEVEFALWRSNAFARTLLDVRNVRHSVCLVQVLPRRGTSMAAGPEFIVQTISG
ncbi:hypothetical protein ACO0K9_24385 [Undibacterium sp. Ji50W]|uniref:hypothetical protein n=1 Tax=Undibacterium sp. Ji50W TaxID=3413041 RepID=UPI003BF22D17